MVLTPARAQAALDDRSQPSRRSAPSERPRVALSLIMRWARPVTAARKKVSKPRPRSQATMSRHHFAALNGGDSVVTVGAGCLSVLTVWFGTHSGTRRLGAPD